MLVWKNPNSTKPSMFYGSIETEQTERIKVNCALSYRKDGRLCDLGSYVNMYPVMLALLGMRVTTVDYYPQSKPQSPNYNPDIHRVLDICRSVGIEVIECDLYDLTLPKEAFDVVTSFETFEHLLHSPKPVMKKIVAALRPGGDVVLSVPNIARLVNRLRVLVGRSPLSSFGFFFENGYPFTGHRREMTIAEVHHMMAVMQLKRKKLFTENLHPPMSKDASTFRRRCRTLTDKLPLPRELRGTIYAVYSKADNHT